MIFYFVVVIVAASIRGTVQLDLECFPDGKMIVKNPDETKFKYFDVNSRTGNENCMGEFSDGYLHLLLQNCKLDESIEVIFLGDNTKVMRKGNFAGPYSITCRGIPKEGINLTISVGLHIKDNSSIPTTIRNLNGTLIVTKLSGGVSTQTVEVSDEGTLLRWFFDAPDMILDFLGWGSGHTSEENTTYHFPAVQVSSNSTRGLVNSSSTPSTDAYLKANLTVNETTQMTTASSCQSALTNNIELVENQTRQIPIEVAGDVTLHDIDWYADSNTEPEPSSSTTEQDLYSEDVGVHTSSSVTNWNDKQT